MNSNEMTKSTEYCSFIDYTLSIKTERDISYFVLFPTNNNLIIGNHFFMFNLDRVMYMG